MIRLLCYEPAGQVLELTSDDLTRHLLALGATGCGKTTGLINPLLRQIIAWQPTNGDRKPGLLVLDPKADDTPDKVQTYAREAGRLDDVVTLSTGGNSYYGYFTGFDRLDQVDEFTRRILYGSQEMGDQNAYWTESRFGLVNSALTVLLARGQPLTFDRVAEFLRAWFYQQNAGEITESLSFVERLLKTDKLRPATRRRLQLALAEAQNWKVLDPRTRELHKSTLNNALRSLLSPAARDLFDENRGRRFNPAEVLSGKILVASLNAVSQPQLASLLFKAVKRDYCEAVLSRVLVRPEQDRLCGLILDELPLSVMPEDVAAFALLRSKGGFVVACAQGINGLDEVLGPRQRSALLTNFNSILYFSGRENQTDEHAMLTLGVQAGPSGPSDLKDAGDLQIQEATQPGQVRLVCPPGSLSRLPQHHAYAKLANGTTTKTPVWLEPSFHEFVPEPIKPPPNDLAEAIAWLRSEQEKTTPVKSPAAQFLIHMHQRGHALQLTPNVVAAAWQLCKPRCRRNKLLARWRGQVQSLEELPSCWLLGFTHWLRKNPTAAPAILRVSEKSGVLWPELDRAWTVCGKGHLNIPESINLFLYPSLWRPLLPRHLSQLRIERPDLRSELQSLPQTAQQTSGV